MLEWTGLDSNREISVQSSVGTGIGPTGCHLCLKHKFQSQEILNKILYRLCLKFNLPLGALCVYSEGRSAIIRPCVVQTSEVEGNGSQSYDAQRLICQLDADDYAIDLKQDCKGVIIVERMVTMFKTFANIGLAP
jgi:hypothetical protein